MLVGAFAALAWAPTSFLTRMEGGYPWVAYGTALLLAWLFQRSRVAVAVMALVVVHLVLDRASTPAAVAAAGAAFALVLTGLALVRDRGLLSPGALGQLLAAAGIGTGTAVVGLAAPSLMARTLSATPLPVGLIGWSRLPQAVFATFALATGVAAWSAIRWGGAVERGLFWTAVAVAAAVALGATGAHAPLFLLAAALILALSVVETSYAMAYRDDLTGLPARRALQRDLAALGSTYAIAMVDVDHFKKFNDRHGHDVGDQVLRMVATQLARVPGGGKAYRYGGEEFTLVFPGRTREDTLPHLETVRTAVQGARFALRHRRRPRTQQTAGRKRRGQAAHAPKELSVTVSLGVADTAGKNATAEAVLKKADRALYRAKRAGRNRVSK